MGEFLYNRLSDLANIVYLFSFFKSLSLIRNQTVPDYMKGFYWYTGIAIFITIMHISEKYFQIIPKDFFRITNLVSLHFHFTFLSLFISRFFTTKQEKNIFKLFFWLVNITIFIFIFIDVIYDFSISFAISNTGLFILCIYYYYLLFRTPPTLNLLKEPSFWIITGILFGMGTTIPILYLAGYLYHNLPKNIFFSIATIVPFGYGIMHLFFIKAFICSVQNHRE